MPSTASWIGGLYYQLSIFGLLKGCSTFLRGSGDDAASGTSERCIKRHKRGCGGGGGAFGVGQSEGGGRGMHSIPVCGTRGMGLQYTMLVPRYEEEYVGIIYETSILISSS